ncbi:MULTISPECIES: helix-turn-helix domain-containing protein [unclassified Streptomyces]|uniref:helix-turn-helix domain-containing protein n=1 Tax=unclassified Streptomyces TaxID=2593676 RepID=UPI0011C88831|nr:helix-turn-helix domain-containing protein [Streptomyces sp. wa22]TXS17803.1 ArsR family transcriptional regulator [Streptomyces sp. wa22]
MLRIHFTAADLTRVRVAASPDPLWEVCMSLHRLRTRQGRRPHASWCRAARARLDEAGLVGPVRSLLLPLVPRTGYFPDFLTPAESAEGIDAGLKGILATSPDRVLGEMERLFRAGGGPSWGARLAEEDLRSGLTRTIRAYHDAVLAPYGDDMQARFDAERAVSARTLLDGGLDGLLRSPGSGAEWKPPVLTVGYPVDRDLRLEGRGLRLIPSYFCRGNPVALADPGLEPVLVYPLRHEPPRRSSPGDHGQGGPLAALIGRTRAAVLSATASGTGATTGEIALAAGVSASSASQHATALRNAGLLVSRRHAMSVLHTPTPLGSTMLAAGGPTGRLRTSAGGRTPPLPGPGQTVVSASGAT